MEVRVAPSPNLRGPQFSRLLYEATLPEDAPKFTPVVTVVAKDPEEAGPVKYSFTEDEEIPQANSRCPAVRCPLLADLVQAAAGGATPAEGSS